MFPLYRKILYFLRCNPVSWLHFIPHSRLSLFSIFYERILVESYQFLYLAFIILSLVVAMTTTIFFRLDVIFVGDSPPPVFIIALPVATGICFILHSAMYIFSKIKHTRKKFWKSAHILNILSFLILCILVGLHNTYFSIGNFLSSLETSFVFKGTVIIFYFQNSFFISISFWLLSISSTIFISSLVYNGRFPITPATVVAVLLVMAATIIVCIMAHVLINLEMRLGFQKIEKRVSTEFEAQRENRKQEGLLLSIFPSAVARAIQHDLKNDSNANAKSDFRQLYIDRFENVSILFADIKGFTSLSTKISAQKLVQTLNELFAGFDARAEIHYCYRIKILGDCYYCVSGLFGDVTDHAYCCVKMGLDMIKHIKKVNEQSDYGLSMRVGIHTGSILCGLIGVHKWQFDVWSNDVTIANSMEATGIPNKIHISATTKEALNGRYVLEPTKKTVSGMNTYLIDPELNISQEGEDIADEMVSSFSADSAISDIYQPSPSHSTIREPGGSSYSPMSVSLNARGKASPITAASQTSVTFVNKNAIIKNKSKGSEQKRDIGMSALMTTLGINRHDSVTDEGRREEEEDEGAHLVKLKEVISENTSIVTLKHSMTSSFSLHFKDPLTEAKFHRESFETIHFFCLGLLSLLIFFYVTQLLILPRFHLSTHICFNITILLTLMITTITLTNKVPLLYAPQLVTINQFLVTQRYVRYSLFLILWFLAYITTTVGIFECEPNAPLLHPMEESDTQHPRCDNMQFYLAQLDILVVYMLMPVTDLPTTALVLATVFGIFTSQIFLPFSFTDTFLLFYNMQEGSSSQFSPLFHFVKEFAVHALEISFICVMVIILHCQHQFNKRINFLQRLQSVKENSEVEAIQKRNNILLRNILPNHVINHFLNSDNKDLYYDYHAEAGVMFASIQGFSEFYNEHTINQQGIECMRFLNEIIADFDQLLMEERFLSIEKIKTIGSTYMVASGVNHEGRMAKNWNHLEQLVEFSFALRQKLDLINLQSFQNFTLRIGISHGPVVAGVIGANKPQYDIWGDTVNLASRMESTGEIGQTQVVQETQALLVNRGYSFQFRGRVDVKGKGSLITYHILPRENTRKSFRKR